MARKLQIFDSIKAASTNLAVAASNHIASGVDRTTKLVNTMSDVLTLALNTSNKLSSIDRKHFLGGKLTNASTTFLNTTSNVVAHILNTKFNRLNGLIATKTHIANALLHISSNFISKTGQLLRKLVESTSPHIVPARKTILAEKLLNTSINLVNVTGQSLANVINATSLILTKSVDDHTQFIAELLHSTSNILNATSNSIENLLNATNHLIGKIIQSKADSSSLVLDETSNLLSASSKVVSAFLNATTILVRNAASHKLTGGGHGFTLNGLTAAHNALKNVFRSASTLLQGAISAKKDISIRLIKATGALLDANIQMKMSLFNGLVDISKEFTNTTTHLIASKLNATAIKLTLHLESAISNDDASETELPDVGNDATPDNDVEISTLADDKEDTPVSSDDATTSAPTLDHATKDTLNEQTELPTTTISAADERQDLTSDSNQSNVTLDDATQTSNIP